MNKLSKALLTTTAAAVAATSAAPAMARDHRDNGISAGDVIAGALIIGGIAAVAGAIGDDDRDDRYDDRRYNDRRYNDYDYGRSGYGNRYGYSTNPRQAVELCVQAAEYEARRRGYRNADVTDVRDIDRTRRGVEVTGRIAVENRGWNNRHGNYGRGWGNDYRGWNQSRHRGYDSGRFTCRVDGGGVRDVRFSGLDWR